MITAWLTIGAAVTSLSLPLPGSNFGKSRAKTVGSPRREIVEVRLREILPSRKIPGKNFSKVRSAGGVLVVQHGVRSFSRFEMKGAKRCAHVVPDTLARIAEFGVSSKGELVAVDFRRRTGYRFARCGAIAITSEIQSAFLSAGVLPTGQLLLGDSADVTISTTVPGAGQRGLGSQKTARFESMPLEPMLRQGRFAALEKQKDWLFAYSFWSRIELKVNGKQIQTIDSIPLPRLERVESDAGVVERLTSTAVAHRAVAYSNDTVYVLPGSRSDKSKHRLIDLYSARTQGYLGTVALKEPILDVSADAQRALVLLPSGVFALELPSTQSGRTVERED